MSISTGLQCCNFGCWSYKKYKRYSFAKALHIQWYNGFRETTSDGSLFRHIAIICRKRLHIATHTISLMLTSRFKRTQQILELLYFNHPVLYINYSKLFTKSLNLVTHISKLFFLMVNKDKYNSSGIVKML